MEYLLSLYPKNRKPLNLNELRGLKRTPNRAVLEPILADLDRIWKLRYWISKLGELIVYKS